MAEGLTEDPSGRGAGGRAGADNLGCLGPESAPAALLKCLCRDSHGPKNGSVFGVS